MTELQLKLLEMTDKNTKKKDLKEELRILDMKYRLATLKAVRMRLTRPL